MEERSNKITFSLSLPTIGFIVWLVFLILKLTHTVDWNWFWIWFPLWIPYAAGLALFILFLPLFFIMGAKLND